jgi:hypothetical protein
VTITTVGYGDLFPKTPVGQVIGSVTILTGIIVLAMPIGVVGANFSTEYYNLLEDKKKRKRMQQQLAAQEEVEEQQDAFVVADGEDKDAVTVEEQVGEEIIKVDRKREELLQKAEAIDNWWKDKFTDVAHRELSEVLRFFVVGFVDADNAQTTDTAGVGLTTHKVHLSQLWDLDALTTMVFKTIASLTSEDEIAEFGLNEAHEARTKWNDFAERCWEYARFYCRVEKRPSAPEFFTMRANIASKPMRGRGGSSWLGSRHQEKIRSQQGVVRDTAFEQESNPEEIKPPNPKPLDMGKSVPPPGRPNSLDTKVESNRGPELPGAVTNNVEITGY